MAANVVLQQFFEDLPRLVEQAHRHVHSSNLNMLEYFSRKLEDSLNVMNIFVSRCEDINASADLILNVRRTLGQVQLLYSRICDVISTDNDYVLSLTSSNDTNIQTEHPYTGLGRPRLNLEQCEIERLYDIYRSWNQVASHLRVSVRTLQRRRIELGLTVSGRTGSRKTYTEISTDNLCDVVREVLQTLPDAGESYVIGACRQRNVYVPRQRVREAIAIVDPVSRALRRTVSIIRRVYSVPAPNSLW